MRCHSLCRILRVLAGHIRLRWPHVKRRYVRLLARPVTAVKLDALDAVGALNCELAPLDI